MITILNSVTYTYAHNKANEYSKVTTGTSLPGSDNYSYDKRDRLTIVAKEILLTAGHRHR